VIYSKENFEKLNYYLELIRGEKEVKENLTFAYDSVETENKNKEVLECQLVTTF